MRSASRSRRVRSRRAPHSTGNSVQSASIRFMISRMRMPNWPAPTTSTRSPGSMTESAPASSAVRPEPGIMCTSFLVWKTSRRASVVGSRTSSSKLRSYWMDGGWFIAWMTGNGSSVGPGIMRTGRVWHWAQLIVRDTIVSFVAGSAGPVPVVGGVRKVRAGSVTLILSSVARAMRQDPVEGGLTRARAGSVTPILARGGASAVGEALGAAVDEVEIPRGHEEPGTLAEDEHGVEPVDRVRQQRHAAAHREEPEGAGHDALRRALGRDPRDEEARREERLAEQTDAEPHMFRRHRDYPPGSADARTRARTSRAGRWTHCGSRRGAGGRRRARRSSRPPRWAPWGPCPRRR